MTNNLTLAMSADAADIATVDGHTERTTVTSDDKKIFSVAVSVSAPDYPPTAEPHRDGEETGSRR